MNVISGIDDLLNHDTNGRSIDLVLPKSQGLVSRRRSYRLYLPAAYDGKTPMPMVMVLHGCKQNHLDMQAVSGFDRIADREGFIVVYPNITSYTGLRGRNCWGWWMPRQRTRGAGEVGDLMQIVEVITREHAVDTTRLHVCGLSAGAAMSVAALATYSDVWSSGASVAGVAYGESARAVKYARFIPVSYRPVAVLERMLAKSLVSAPPDLLVIQSTTDAQVDVKASEILVETWRRAASLHEDIPAESVSGTARQVPWKYAQYNDSGGNARLGYLTVEGIDHGWIGGDEGKFSTTEGPNVSELIWAFFSSEDRKPVGK